METSADCQELPLAGRSAGLSALAKQVPHQAQQVLISWIFILASTTLFLDFLSLQQLVAGGSSYFVKLNNWFGVVSCFSWLLGFAVLQHWLVRVKATLGGRAGAWTKLVAALFFNLQPMTGTAGTAGGAGLWWSNLAGISFFHAGNLISCADFRLNTPPGADRAKGWLYHGNLPITGMWVYQLATWFLVCGNLLSCGWGGSPSASWEPVGRETVRICQYSGSLLLLLGSCIYCHWCDGFRTCAF
ncbi:unnamed protein product [Polarella glacialis]|uniref:Uncharacterized protein n=1 Tax=Polarella glacialis TaxID=89957 RepID=A0A813IUQ5_POLGL|nr:unnamed protein product [Polarella glacialis]